MVVAQLWRYPVKSLRGERLGHAEFAPGGILFDRRYTVGDPNPRREGKPLTARIEKRLLAYRSSVADGHIRVTTPSGVECAADDRAWLDELGRELGTAIEAKAEPEAIHDAADVLVINAASIRALADEYGKPVDPLRFRPNVLLDGPDATPFEERSWEGVRVRLGSAELEATFPCERCVLTTIDPTTLEMDPSFLRLVVEKHSALMGMYFRVVRAGVAAEGDVWTMHREAELPR